MNISSRKMNSEINVKEIFWRFFEQWKAVLLFSLVVALFATGIKYYFDLKEYSRPNETVNLDAFRGDTDEILEGLSDTDRTAVQKLMKEKNLLDVRKEYCDNSLVYHMDPGDCHILRLQYEVKSDTDGDKTTLIDAYKNCLISEDAVASLGEVISPDTDTKYIYELFTAAGYGDTEKGLSVFDAKDSLIICMLLPQNADATAIQNKINDLLSKHKSELTNMVSEHEIKLISSEIVKYTGIELAQEQNGVMNSVNTAQTEYDKNYALLSEEQRNAYNMIMALQSPDTAEMSVTEEKARPEISKKTFVAGFIIGAFIYGAVLGFTLLLRRRVISAADINYYPGINNLFVLNNYSEKKGLMNSKVISKLRRKREPIEKQVDNCADEISLICSSNCLSKVTIMSPGIMDEKCDILIRDICKKLNSEGIKASVMKVENADMMVEKRPLAESSPVIPVIVEDKTKLDGFNNLMNLCKYLNCNVLGTIYYGEK